MARRGTWAGMAGVGAIVGLIIGIVLAYGFDSGAPGDSDYEAGRRVGFVFRYVVLGAIGFALAAKVAALRRAGEDPSHAAYLGLAVVVLLAIVPPIVQGRPGDQQRDEFRAGFIAGCIDNSRPPLGEKAARSYCECMHDTLVNGRDKDELRRLMRATDLAIQSGQQPPAEVVSAAERCAARVS
jgi:hypothetical protein